MNVIEDGFAQCLEYGDCQPSFPAVSKQIGDGEHHAVVEDVPTDGFT